MAALVSILVFGLHFTLSDSTGCPSQFTQIHGVCLYKSSVDTTWCLAQAACGAAGGELVRGNNYQALDAQTSDLPPRFWVGLTDFQQERHSSQSDWQWSDGAVTPQSASLTWLELTFPSEDCVRANGGKLQDWPCEWAGGVAVCQPSARAISVFRLNDYKPVSIPVESNSLEYAALGCTKLLTVSSQLDCGRRCNCYPAGACLGFYIHKETMQCRLLLHMDAKVNMGNAEGWIKFMIQ